MGCQSRSRNYFVARHHGEEKVPLAWHPQASIIPTRFPPCLSIAQELMLGGAVAKRDALFSTESLWDTQVGHQGVGENQKNKGMRPLLPLHPPIAGLSNQGSAQASGRKTRGLDERRRGGWEATLQKTDPIKCPKQLQDISKDLLLKKPKTTTTKKKNTVLLSMKNS